MTRIPVISGLEMVKVLYHKGWKPVRQVGTSHLIMKKVGVPDLLSIPMKDELKPGIVHTCIRIAGLTDDDF
jgi:predicted RNA binding protein YcfA (HicA-like mRNA interferase family)